MLEIGAELRLIPFVSVDYYGRAMPNPVPCKVVYINEQHKFYTVEFRFPNGYRCRESFKFEGE